jgi:serine/threonine protein phosphatase PrpC
VSSDPVLTEATAAAQATVAALGEGAAPGLAPSSTFVATVARPVDDVLHLDVAWLGDSRAYWIGDDEAVQLTQDHEIEGSLTRWLGADAAEVAPGVAHYLVDAPGVVMVCSDGLWRYGDPPSALHQLVTDLRADHPTDGDLAAALVTHALDGGGHDNISIALWPWPGPGLGAAGPSPNQSKETR